MPIPNNTVKAAFISHYKGESTVTDLLANGADSVKEAQYQASDYNYPALRVRILRQTPVLTREQCLIARLNATIACFVEGPSSKPCDELAGVIYDVTHKRKIAGGTIGTDAFYIPAMYVTGLEGAIRLNERLWLSEILVEGNVCESDDMGGS